MLCCQCNTLKYDTNYDFIAQEILKRSFYEHSNLHLITDDSDVDTFLFLHQLHKKNNLQLVSSSLQYLLNNKQQKT